MSLESWNEKAIAVNFYWRINRFNDCKNGQRIYKMGKQYNESARGQPKMSIQIQLFN